MLAAPEFVEPERVDLLDKIEITTKLQHRMLADRMVRGEKGSEFQACHGVSLRTVILVRANATWPRCRWQLCRFDARPRMQRRALSLDCRAERRRIMSGIDGENQGNRWLAGSRHPAG